MSKRYIIVDNSTEPATLEDYANTPGVTLDVTNLDLRRLPLHVKSGLYTKGRAFDAPQLQTSGDIFAPSATNFSAPQLQTSGDINASRATSFSAPQLRTSGQHLR